MKLFLALPLTVFLAGLIGGSAFAQLKWETKRIELQAKPGEEKTTAEFNFENAGAKPIHLLDVKTACDCTAANVEKRTFAPGEKGKIAVTFTIGDRHGLQEKPVTVVTDAPDATQLMLAVQVPELLTFDPRFLSWPVQSGAAPAPKAIHVTATAGVPINIVSIEPSDPRVHAHLHVLEPGKKYEIAVSLDRADERFFGQLKVRTDFPKAHPKTYEISTLVEKSLAGSLIGFAAAAAVAIALAAGIWFFRRQKSAPAK